nr:MAG TPA: RRN7 Zinc-finger of RNA-polymerase I-specific TFIIB, Rrn7 [Caudoviricetes sp.]
MPACKVCGRWFAKIRDDEELCDKCGVALSRLSGYVVPVVRCKDCKFNSGAKKCLNPNSFIAVPADDDFCSYGEKRA